MDKKPGNCTIKKCATKKDCNNKKMSTESKGCKSKLELESNEKLLDKELLDLLVVGSAKKLTNEEKIKLVELVVDHMRKLEASKNKEFPQIKVELTDAKLNVEDSSKSLLFKSESVYENNKLQHVLIRFNIDELEKISVPTC